MSEYSELVEQYRKKLLEGVSQTDYSALYQNAAEALMNAQNAAYESRVAELKAELPAIAESYDDARGKAYRNAKLSAVSENEALAAMGLAGNLHQDAKSGVSESSRISADNALRENINLLNESQLRAEREVDQQISEAGAERDEKASEIMADYAAQLAEYQQVLKEEEQRRQEQEYARQQEEKEYELKLRQQEYDQLKYQLQLQQIEEEKRQTEIQNALKEVDAFGRVMTQSAADALGVPVGTLSYTAQLAADKLSAKKSSGSSSKNTSSAKGSEEFNAALEKAKQYLSIPTDTYSASYSAALYGINVSELPAYQANEFLKGQVRNKTLTEKERSSIKSILGI